MAISDADCKLLWGRAAGICSNPACRDDLTVILEGAASYNIGEMAHVIARKPDGPRGQKGGGPDSYANLILLCPTCHTHVDKAPSEYPEDLLRTWKKDHEAEVRNIGKQKKFESLAELKKFVNRLLVENGAIWKTLGPKSDAAGDSGSNLYRIWNFRKLDTIIPHNREIINAVEANINLISQDEYEHFVSFKNHALAFEKHQYNRLDTYPLFPGSFEERFRP